MDTCQMKLGNFKKNHSKNGPSKASSLKEADMLSIFWEFSAGLEIMGCFLDLAQNWWQTQLEEQNKDA